MRPTVVRVAAFETQDSEMLRMHNCRLGNAAMQKAHMFPEDRAVRIVMSRSVPNRAPFLSGAMTAIVALSVMEPSSGFEKPLFVASPWGDYAGQVRREAMIRSTPTR